MTTVSCTGFVGSSVMDRATINKQQFVEVQSPMTGGSQMDAAEILTGKEVVVVDDWTPEDDAHDVGHGHSALVDLHATSDTVEHEELYDSDADWETGTHDDTKATGDALTLSTTPFEEDFEGVTPLNDWSTRLPTGGGSYYITTDGGSEVLYVVNWNDHQVFTPDNGPDSDDQIVRMDIKFNTANINGFTGPCVRLTGSGTALRGYFIELRYNTNQLKLNRITGDGTWSYINAVTQSKWITTGTWYTVMMRATGTSFYYKLWLTDTESEPASWIWIGSHTSWTTGETGIYTRSSSGNENYHFDNYAAESDPPAYAASGEWLSGALDVTSVEHYSHCLVEWDETLPTDTTAAVKVRWRPTDSWVACTNGAEIPGIERGYNMEEGSPFTELYVQILLGTTDDSETPSIENLRFLFEPVAPSALLLDLGGDFDCTVENGLLDYWHRSHVSGGSAYNDYDDIKIQTDVPRWMPGRATNPVLTLKYGGVTIDSIVWNMARDTWMEMNDLTGFYWGLTPLVYEAAPVEVRYGIFENWTPGSHVYEWVLVDKNIAIHADAWFLVGRPQIDNIPGSLLAGVAERSNYPGSMLAKGYQLDDNIGHALVQGWRFDQVPGMVMPAVEFLNDTPGSVLLGSWVIDNQPGMVLVYGVNREGSVFVNVIDDNTYQTLLDAGITFS